MTEFKTADLYDAYGIEVHVMLPMLRHFGGVRRFCGPIVTIRTFEDNLAVQEQLEEPGDGRVIVIDGGGSLHAALVGDRLAQRGMDMGYSGFVVNGCVRDVAECGSIAVGLMAIASNPTRPRKKGFGERALPVAFGGVKFSPADWLYADEDGIIVCARKLA